MTTAADEDCGRPLRHAARASFVPAVLGLLISVTAGAFQPQRNPNGIRWQSSSSETWSGSSQSDSLGRRAQLAGTYDAAGDASNPLGIAAYFGLFGPVLPLATPSPTPAETPGNTVTPMPSPTPASTEEPTSSPTASPTILPPTYTPTPAEPVLTSTPTALPTLTPTGTAAAPTATPSCSVAEQDYDLNSDGKVSAEDLFLFVRAVKQAGTVPDFNCDGETDARDLFLLAQRWETEIPARSP